MLRHIFFCILINYYTLQTNGLWDLRKLHHIILGPKLVRDMCSIGQIPCVCVACTNILDNTWYPSEP